MKKLLLAGIFACLAGTFAAHAQQHVAYVEKNSVAVSNPVFQDLLFFDGAIKSKGNGVQVTAAAIGSRVQKTFATRYGDRPNVTWTQLNKKTFLAEFDMEGRKTNALFYNNGYMEYAVSYGTAQNMPKNIQRLMQAYYPDYRVGATFEVKFKDRAAYGIMDETAWVVNLESDKDFVTARVIDGTVDELARMQKELQAKTRKGKIIIPRQ